jgi:hypothetical protein
MQRLRKNVNYYLFVMFFFLCTLLNEAKKWVKGTATLLTKAVTTAENKVNFFLPAKEKFMNFLSADYIHERSKHRSNGALNS